MFDLASKTELSVKDFKSYPDEFPFRDASCLTRSPDTSRKDLAKMHAEDEADDQLIADALQSHVITRSQSQAVERANQNALVPSVNPQPAAAKRPSKKGAKAVLVSKPLSAAKDYLDIPMSEMQELLLAHAFVTHKFQVTLPARYNPAGMPTPKGEMVVVAVKAQKQTRDKATVWVEFLSPPSHVGKQIQLYPKNEKPRIAAHHMIWREILLQLFGLSGDEGDEHKWVIPSAVSADSHKELTVRQIIQHFGFFASDAILEDKISAFFAQRATLALSHVGHLQDPTDPTSLALDAESHADFLTRLRFSTHTLTDNRVRRLSDQELQTSVSAFLDLRPDGFAFHQNSKRVAILELTRAMDSSGDWETKKDAEKRAR
jgi:hypothetical protein